MAAALAGHLIDCPTCDTHGSEALVIAICSTRVLVQPCTRCRQGLRPAGERGRSGGSQSVPSVVALTPARYAEITQGAA